MTIVHKAGNIRKNDDGLSRWELPITSDNPAYALTSPEPQISIEGINITDVGKEFFEEVRESYKQDRNFHILTASLDKGCKYLSLVISLDDIWKTSYDNGRFHLFDCILYYRSEHTCFMVLCSRMLINTILLECHENIYFEHQSEDRQWKELRHVPGGHLGEKMSLSTVIVLIDATKPIKLLMGGLDDLFISKNQVPHGKCFIWIGYSKTPIFLQCHKHYTAMDTAILIWSRVISHTGLFKNIISDRDPKFTSALWTNIKKLLCTKLPFLTAYHPQTDGLGERMIQTLEDMIRRFFAYGLELKDYDGFTHDWCTLIPELELSYNTSIHASTGKTAAIVEKGLNPKLPVDTLKKDLIDLHPTALSFKLLLDKVRHHEKQSMNYAFEYAKQKWDKSHKIAEFKVGNSILVSTLNFIDIKGAKKLKYSFEGPLIIKALHGKNAVQVEISGESKNKHPNFPVSLENQ
ncbi:hypothetical protein O181_044384 [Austropuccinia psidii MF-1]|uniref:Integrase catalytic domain-containing protein n=1 Tax=Austropuccinia psidii MF-1 TaxID=1389203 RepID=A0A9Q3HJC7_9BASI|nr:hypothetical protein [Austropuccinia psidii MF-1]